MRGVHLVPYRLPELIAAVAAGDTVYVAEGERDADAIGDGECVATCNPGGAGKWRASYSAHFKGARDVRVVADNDDPGRKHAREVAHSLTGVGAMVTLWRSPVGKDVSDLLAAGRPLEDLVALDCDSSTPDVEPPALSVGEFFNESGLKVKKLGIIIRDLGHVEAGSDGRLYRYLDGVHRTDGDSFTRVRVREILGERYRRRHSDEVLSWLRADEPSITDQPRLDVINVANGLLDWRAQVLAGHSPETLSTIQVPVRWNPAAECSLIDTFLERVIPEDAVALVFEMVGYSLYAGNPLRVAVLLLGPGCNGKSVLLSVIKTLLGPANVSAIPLQMLSESRFASAELFGKLANICGDLDARTIKQTDVFKMITGGDAITAERKYCSAFTFTPFALQIFSANEAPFSSDQTQAWFDRWLVIPMEKRIPVDQIDPHLTAKLTAPRELEGLLVKAIHGLGRLMERGRFERPGSIEQAGSEYRERLDTVQGFVTEACTLVIGAWTSRADLYSAYRAWVTDGGRFPLSRPAFNDHLRRGFPGEVEQRTRNGARGWGGIGLLAQDRP
jgi:putative DNA primase/helicase